MPSKKKKYNARFPAGRIKKIMQTDEEVGKVAQAVPVIISRTLELFVESLLTKSMQITQSRSAKTLTPSHMKQCILSESRFDFLKDLVKNIPDASIQEDNENNAAAVETPESTAVRKEPEKKETGERRHSKPETELTASFYIDQQSTSTARTPSVIQYVPKLKTPPAETVTPRLNFSVESLVKQQENKLQVDVTNIPPLVPALPANNQNSNSSSSSSSVAVSSTVTSPSANRLPSEDNLPQLIPISHNFYAQNNSGDNLYIDEDYDN